MILILIFLVFHIFFFSVQAQEFVSYQNNPIIFKESTHNGAVMPFVLKESNKFSLWYADDTGSSFRIFRMQSANGIDWYEKKDTSVTSRHNASDPFVTFEDNQYTLYFASSDFRNISLWESKSLDGITFSVGTEKEILKSEAPWEGGHLSCPSVIKENGMYYLFYAGSGVSNWGIGLATSSDGKAWQKCPNNPLIAPGASEQLIKYNDLYYLFFQSPRGLEVQQTNFLNGCNTVWTNKHIVASPLRDPSPLIVDNNLWLYGTLPTETGLHIGVASTSQISSPTYPIIIIPGMFASWNKDALLHNNNVHYSSWKLNPGVTEYDALEKTLENRGRKKNMDYFIFPYDWRASLTKTVSNLDQFLYDSIWSNHPYLPVQIIGHSLGGTITRLYTQNNGQKPIKNIITAGSPHLGAIQAYKPLMSGEIDRENSLMWLAEKLILLLNKSKIENDKDTIGRMLPIMKDLLPTFPYLKDENGSFINSSISNDVLTNNYIDMSIKKLYMGGVAQQVNAGYILGQRTPLDILLNTYPDGHPQNTWQDKGDGVILLKSTLNQVSPAPTSNHGEIIFSKENIKTILSSLDLQTQESDIPEGKATSIFPAILAFIQSPATIELEHNEIITKENEGMIWIQNAENGTYKLTATGTETGEYTANIWLIGKNDDKWVQFKKATSNDSKNIFIISFDGDSGGVVEEYMPPSPIPTPTNIPSPTPALSLPVSPSQTNSQSSFLQSSSGDINSSSSQKSITTTLTDFVKQDSPFFSSSAKQVASTPKIKRISSSEEKILGASTKKVQKGGESIYYGIVVSLIISSITILVSKRKTLSKWISMLKHIRR